MARFERSRERKSPPQRGGRGGFEDRDSGRGGRSFEDRPRSRDSGRGRRNFEDWPKSGRYSGGSRDRRAIEMTKVTCSSCGSKCEVPFKPTSSKPVYCSDCFVKTNKAGSDKISNRDLDIINEKLDKIMKTLDIK